MQTSFKQMLTFMLVVPLLAGCTDAGRMTEPGTDVSASVAVRPSLIRLTATIGDDSVIFVGDTARVTLALSMGAASATAVTAKLATVDTAIVRPLRGVPAVVGLSAGKAKVILRWNRSVDTVTVRVMERPVVTSLAVGRTVALSLQRFDGSSGPVLVSSGVPLAKGQAFPADIGHIRLVVRGTEVRARIVALSGLHPDGSLRSVLVQVPIAIGSESVPAELQIGTAPALSALPPQPTSAKPTAMAIPTTAQLIASHLVGPTRSIDSTSLAGFDQLFRQNADAQWTQFGADWTTNYYDRVLNHVAYWVRGGGTSSLRRALDVAVEYRTKYLEANQYGASPHWSQLEGMAVHYWLTGDEASRTAVLRTTDRMDEGFTVANMSAPAYQYNEGRIQARLLLGNALASALEGGDKYKTNAAGYVGAIVGLMRADGSYSWPNWCGLQSNYMVALQNDAMIKYTELVATDSRIAPAMKKSLDYLWRTQWNSSAQGFQYASGSCTNVGGTEAAPDLNMLFVSSFAWYGMQSGDATYRQRADEIALGGIAKAWISPTKQFNEFFYGSFNYLAYRRQ